jgi:DNA-binding beta-propeller fold protein YncE
LILSASMHPAAAAPHAAHMTSIPCEGGEYFAFTPLGLAFDAAGRLYVIDADNSRIMVLDDSLDEMRPFSDFFRDSVGLSFVDVETRDGLTVYVSEESRGELIGFDRIGRPRASIEAGQGTAGFDIGAAGKVCAANPLYELVRVIYLDGDRDSFDCTLGPEAGQALFVDCLVLPRGGFVATAADQTHLLHFNAVGKYMGALSAYEFTEPYGVASFNDEYILVTDAGAQEVVILDMRGKRIGSFGAGILKGPAFVAVRRDGTVCVSDTDRRTIEVFGLEID